MKGRKGNGVSPYGSGKGKRPIFNGPETFPDKPAERPDMPPITGGKARMRLDRPGRKLGGRVGSDRSPLSSAARAEDPEPACKASGGRLTAKERNALPGKDFALSGRRYPINDASHARNALARVSQHGSPAEKSKVRSAVHRKFPEIEQSK